MMILIYQMIVYLEKKKHLVMVYQVKKILGLKLLIIKSILLFQMMNLKKKINIIVHQKKLIIIIKNLLNILEKID